MYKETLCIIAALFCFAAPIASAEELSDAVVRVYHQVVTFKIDRRWIQGYRSEEGASFLLEIIPPGETVDSWTRMLTVQGFRGLASSLSAPRAFEAEAKSIKAACPGDFASLPLQKPAGVKEDAVFVVMGCGKHPAHLDQSEFGVYAFLRGDEDIYLIKKSFREPNGGGAAHQNLMRYQNLAPEVFSVRLSAVKLPSKQPSRG